MKIGVFDSGVGGMAVANAIKNAFPEIEIEVRNDQKHVPYGLREPSEILSFVKPIIQDMINNGCQIIVIACNTVTTNIIDDLRKFFSIPLIGIEPMIKPASKITKSKNIAVCATPTTLKSKRYKLLKNTFANGIKVQEPDCSDWSQMIEAKQINQEKIANIINNAIDNDADVIVLACTHYHWIENEINLIANGRAVVMQPEPAIIARLKTVIRQLQ